MKKFIHTAVFLLALVACSKTEQVGRSELVVEGWIENGGHPVVMVSESIGIATGRQMGYEEILEHIGKWAKVTVSDGTTTEILTGVADSRYFPPYIFTSSNITGEVGKTYTLKVEYKDYLAQATTTIPEPVPIEDVYVQSVTDTIAALRVCFTDPAPKGNNYKVFTKTEGKDETYFPSALTTMTDEELDGYTETTLYSTTRLMVFGMFPNIIVGDVMWIKLRTLDQKSFVFWKNFEIFQSYENPNIRFDSHLGSNMNGALGYWAGYGVDKEYRFTVENPNE